MQWLFYNPWHFAIYKSIPTQIFLFSALSHSTPPGEGSEEIGNMIQNYIKEIEDLRYSV